MKSISTLFDQLKQYAEDGNITPPKVWELANFLNNDAKQRATWPGSVLFRLCTQAYADGDLSPDNLESIQTFIGKLFCTAPHATAENRLIVHPAAIIGIQPLSLPPGLIEPKGPTDHSIEENPEDNSATLSTCSCEDWTTNRATLPLYSPGRFCIHQAALAVARSKTEPLSTKIVAILQSSLNNNVAAVAQPTWGFVELENYRFVLCWGLGTTLHIYQLGPTDRVGSFSIDLTLNDWSIGTRKDFAILLTPLAERIAAESLPPKVVSDTRNPEQIVSKPARTQDENLAQQQPQPAL